MDYTVITFWDLASFTQYCVCEIHSIILTAV